MASTVGQVIVNARQTIPDMPQTMPPPVVSAALPQTVGGGIFTPGVYEVGVTAINAFGETILSNENSVTITLPNNAFNITVAAPYGTTGLKFYWGTGGVGSEVNYIILPGAGTGSFIVSGLAPQTPAAGAPPQLARAWLPDTDGGLISAGAVFGWLNDGLRMISRHAGGLLDYSGIGSVSNQPLYIIPQEWIAITSIWYDGYWMVGGDRGYFWRRNNITSQILSSATISVINNQNILEVYPQPARTAFSTTLAGGPGMGATDVTAALTSTAGFLLPFGFFQVDTGASAEICGYNAISGNSLIGLLRGLGGSAAVAHIGGAPVQELNIFWNGKRQLEPSYAPGQSASLIPLPSGWDILLAQYIAGRAKNIEHDGQYWQQLEQTIKQSLQDFNRMQKGVMRRRQVGPPTSPATFYNTPAGGLLIN